MKNLLSKPVYQRELDGKLVNEWKSIKEAARKTGYASQNISACCNGKIQQLHGYFWSFDKDYIGKKERRKDCKSVYQYDLDGNLIKKWNSLADIEDELGYSSNNISHCCLKDKYVPSAYGYIWSYEQKDDIKYVNKNIQKQKKIYQLTKNMEIIKVWDNLEDIEHTLNYNRSAISACCRCKCKTAYGYIWRYDETLNNKPLLISAQAKPVLQMDKQYNIVAKYNSITEAQRITGINNISNCCNGKYKTAGGYIWRFSDDLEKIS